MRLLGTIGLGVMALTLGLGACQGLPSNYDDSDPLRGDGGAGGGDGGGDPTGANSGLPCDVAQVLVSKCTSCHGNTLSGGAPIRLTTYDDLVKASAADPAKTVAERSLLRMQDATVPMPPKPLALATTQEIAAFSAWVAAGRPKGTCGGGGDGGVSDPFGVPPTCTSMKTWNPRNKESELMNPGQACVACHTLEKEGPIFSIAGTLYPTGHEPDLCLGSSAQGAVVVITDAAGKTLRLTANSSGNFTSRSALTPPYTATVQFQGRERAMATPQTSGDCNTCHTQSGASKAPGRIVLP